MAENCIPLYVYLVVAIAILTIVMLCLICYRNRKHRLGRKRPIVIASPVCSSPLFNANTSKSLALLELGIPAPPLSLSMSVDIRRGSNSQNETTMSSPGFGESPALPSSDGNVETSTEAMRTFNDQYFVLSQRGQQSETTRRNVDIESSAISNFEEEVDRSSSVWNTFLDEGRSMSVYGGEIPDIDESVDLNNSFLVPPSLADEDAHNEFSLSRINSKVDL
ncbi:hypothetical protein THRCLA_02725 [Thraustotheca clavata]|uniref:Uncharacterized protein n=1 Tax=Thraustotheca clavata TaxID=74557 RepID=A0A1W0A4C3_9STRA|nr:hypothetical protein THRCLA_02725 [Thraustotheca clavata]